MYLVASVKYIGCHILVFLHLLLCLIFNCFGKEIIEVFTVFFILQGCKGSFNTFHPKCNAFNWRSTSTISTFCTVGLQAIFVWWGWFDYMVSAFVFLICCEGYFHHCWSIQYFISHVLLWSQNNLKKLVNYKLYYKTILIMLVLTQVLVYQ